MADIVIESMEDREVECKVVCRGKTGSWSLQADKATLQKKGSCDFLYLLFDRTHENVAVLLFANLVPDDFYAAHEVQNRKRGPPSLCLIDLRRLQSAPPLVLTRKLNISVYYSNSK